jgi:hypothetical protein
MSSFYEKAAEQRAARLAVLNPDEPRDERWLGKSGFNRAEVADPHTRAKFYPTELPKNRREKIKAKAKAKALAYHGPVQALFPLTRRKGTEHDAFLSHWRDTHKTLVEGFLEDLGAFKYEQLLSLPNPYEKRHGRPVADQYDGVAILWWKDRKTKIEAGKSSRGRRAARHIFDDDREFLDLDQSHSILAEQRFDSGIGLPPMRPHYDKPKKIVAPDVQARNDASLIAKKAASDSARAAVVAHDQFMAAFKLRAANTSAMCASFAIQAAECAKKARELLGYRHAELHKAMQWHSGNEKTDTPRLDEGWKCGSCRQRNVALALICIAEGCNANPRTGNATYEAPEEGVFIPLENLDSF